MTLHEATAADALAFLRAEIESLAVSAAVSPAHLLQLMLPAESCTGCHRHGSWACSQARTCGEPLPGRRPETIGHRACGATKCAPRRYTHRPIPTPMKCSARPK